MKWLYGERFLLTVQAAPITSKIVTVPPSTSHSTTESESFFEANLNNSEDFQNAEIRFQQDCAKQFMEAVLEIP